MKRLITLRWQEILLIVFLMLSHLQMNAQSTYGGAGYFGFRMNKYDFTNLNNVFSTNNLPILSENILGYGGGGHGYIDRLILGGEGFSYEVPERNNGIYKTNIQGGVGFFNIGYVLLNKSRVMISPMLGIGAATMDINIYENTSGDFNQIITNPKKGTRLKNEQFLLDLGVQSNVFLTRNKFFSIGVKAGYQLAPIEGRWSDVNGTIANGPPTNFDAAYAQISFCFGGFSK